MDGSAFQPAGKTFVFTATEDSDQPLYLPSDVDDVNQYRIYNSGVATVFITIAPSRNEVIAQSGIPTEESPEFSVPVTPGAVEIFSGPDNAYICAFTEASLSKIYVTPGRGM